MPVCVCYSIPEYVDGMVLALLVIWVMLLLKNPGMGAHVPLHCPGTGTGVGLDADVSVALSSFCVERSCAAELCLSLMWLFPQVRWQGRGGLSRSWWCFCTMRDCCSQCFCSTTALAGVGSVPEGTFIATGRERLICMTIAGFSWGV